MEKQNHQLELFESSLRIEKEKKIIDSAARALEYSQYIEPIKKSGQFSEFEYPQIWEDFEAVFVMLCDYNDNVYHGTRSLFITITRLSMQYRTSDCSQKRIQRFLEKLTEHILHTGGWYM